MQALTRVSDGGVHEHTLHLKADATLTSLTEYRNPDTAGSFTGAVSEWGDDEVAPGRDDNDDDGEPDDDVAPLDPIAVPPSVANTSSSSTPRLYASRDVRGAAPTNAHSAAACGRRCGLKNRGHLAVQFGAHFKFLPLGVMGRMCTVHLGTHLHRGKILLLRESRTIYIAI